MCNDPCIKLTKKEMFIQLNRDNKTFTLTGDNDDVNLYLIPKEHHKKIMYTLESDGINVSNNLNELVNITLNVRSPAFGPVFDNVKAGRPPFANSTLSAIAFN